MSDPELIFSEAFDESVWTESAESEFEQIGAPLQAASMKSFFPKKPQLKSKDWAVPEVTSLIHLFEKYQQVGMSLSKLTKKPSDVARYRVNSATSHYIAIALVFTQRYGKVVVEGASLWPRVEFLVSFFKYSWRFFIANKNKQTAYDIQQLFNEIPEDNEALFQKIIERDQNGAQYGIKDINTLNDLKDSKKNKNVQAFVFDLMQYIEKTRLAFSGKIKMSLITDKEIRKLTELALKQAGLIVSLYALMLNEVSQPSLLVESLQLSDELAATTQKLSVQLQTLPGSQNVKENIDYDVEKMLKTVYVQPEPLYARVSLRRGPAIDPADSSTDNTEYGVLPEYKEEQIYGDIPVE